MTSPSPPVVSGGAPSSDNNNTQILSSMHMDYVHCVEFDVYGRRMATCSGDRFVRIWDLQNNGEWKMGSEFQAGAVSQLKWAHPEFGPLLATCGSDHDAKIWEEREPDSSSNTSRWIEKAKLTEARRAVVCCAFGPRHAGLKLATGSSDGSVRIYEAVDVMNLAQWPLQATISIHAGKEQQSDVGVTCLSWCTGRFEPPTIVVGGGQSLAVYRYSDATRTWQSMLTLPSSSFSITDVAWAPNVGRRYHLIASADRGLKVFKLNRKGQGLELVKTDQLLDSDKDENKMWKVEWNVTGTVLASSGDGGVVQLYKSDFEGNWKCVSQIYGDLNTMG